MASISLATLLEIIVPSPSNPSVVAQILRYQNYQSADIAFNGNLYSYIGFHVAAYPESDLSMGNTDCQIAIRNSQIIRGLLEQYNDLKRSIVSIYNIQPGTTVPARLRRLVISHTTTEGGLIMFTARSPTSALSGALVTRQIDAKDFPELPYYRMQA